MQLINAFTTVFLAASVIAQRPYVFITRDDGTKSTVGGSIGCFGTSGRIREADITKGYEATFFTDYNCRGSQTGPYRDVVTFGYPTETKSVRIDRIVTYY
jgi:hypothetical protein